MIVMTYIYDYIYLYVANWIIDVRNIKATFFMFLINLIHIITPLLDRVEFASLEKLFRLETWPACLMRRDSQRIILCWTLLKVHSSSRISLMFLSLRD